VHGAKLKLKKPHGAGISEPAASLPIKMLCFWWPVAGQRHCGTGNL
jgi:hypothetical protein